MGICGYGMRAFQTLVGLIAPSNGTMAVTACWVTATIRTMIIWKCLELSPPPSQVLFADEPTSGLDSEMAADMMGALVRRAQPRGAQCGTAWHDLGLKPKLDARCLTLDPPPHTQAGTSGTRRVRHYSPAQLSHYQHV